jgi:hypothetical protein
MLSLSLRDLFLWKNLQLAYFFGELFPAYLCVIGFFIKRLGDLGEKMFLAFVIISLLELLGLGEATSFFLTIQLILSLLRLLEVSF